MIIHELANPGNGIVGILFLVVIRKIIYPFFDEFLLFIEKLWKLRAWVCPLSSILVKIFMVFELITECVNCLITYIFPIRRVWPPIA